MIHVSLITQPLTLRQRWAMIVMTDAPRPMTAVELAAQVKQRFNQKRFGQVSILLSSLVARGLVRRYRVGSMVLYSRTGVQW